MPTKAIFYCDGPDCERHAGAFDGRQGLPPGFLRVEWGDQHRDDRLIFCNWDCVLKYGATIPPSETIPLYGEPDSDELDGGS